MSALNAIIINFNTKTIFRSHVVCGILPIPGTYSHSDLWTSDDDGDDARDKSEDGFNLIHLTLRYFYL